MSDTLHPSLKGLEVCGCCAGTGAETPRMLCNPAGQTALHYRIGTYAEFRATMLAALTAEGRDPLHALATREADDFTIALLDAWAVVADILSFYQERLANESYLRTALDEGSVRRLARLIGYQPAPGVAASAWLAFTLETAAGAPGEAILHPGLKVQSVPGQDEKPQTFETVETLEARAEWNALRPSVTEAPGVAMGQTELYLAGTATQLQKGDAILIIGDERIQNPTTPGLDERWDFRILTSVVADPDHDWTRVTWDEGLGHPSTPPPAENVRVFAFRQRGALFGHNAPDPNMITVPSAAIESHLFNLSGGLRTSWKDYQIRNRVIDLDASYPKVVPGGWVALERAPQHPGDRGYAEVYRALDVSFPSVSRFGLSSKVTRVVPDTTERLTYDFFHLDETVAYFQSEELAMAAPPRRTRPPEALTAPIALDAGSLAPLEGTRLLLAQRITVLPPGRALVVSGRRSRVRVTPGAPSLTLTDATGTRSADLAPGDSLVVLAPPGLSGGTVTWQLRHDDGFDGELVAATDYLLLTAARREDPLVSEQVTVEACSPGTPTEVELSGGGLKQLYDRATVTIAANVALGSHGETIEELAGSGDASQRFQQFALKQTPLTHLPGEGTVALASTLEVRVDDLLWREVASLHDRGPEEHVYVTRPGDDESVTVHFGNGVNGARLPTGEQNVRFKYRKGSGLEGMVRAGQLSQLLTRPLGLREVSNPLAAEGADEAETLEDARQNAPLTVLTLERAVSLQDYEDFARAYPGIGKALATWTWDGRTRGILLTVAGPEGVDIVPGGLVETGLSEALRASGDPFVPLRVLGYRRAEFEVAGTVEVHPDYEAEAVLEAVRDELHTAFAFAARRFGQPVFLSEVLGVMHRVAGVLAVDVDHLQRTDAALAQDPAPRLLAEFPAMGAAAGIAAAELLLLAAGDLTSIGAKHV